MDDISTNSWFETRGILSIYALDGSQEILMEFFIVEPDAYKLQEWPAL